MRRFRSARLILLALLIALIPASSFAGVLISVGFAPPPLPVYEQPLCPEAGWMWIPGYWAYGPDGYYWVPGTWAPAPEPGLYWTPGYWGWSAGLYVWNPGYWGRTVGYYGGVNYGFGFFGVGFVGGVWRGGVFSYNTAVVHVNTTVIHNVYVDRTVIASHTVAANSHVAFSGGPGGINHPMTASERAAMNQRHVAPTAVQTQHETAAMHDTNSYASHNGGHPTNAAVARPSGGGTHPGSASRSAPQPRNEPQPHNAPQQHPAPQPHNAPAPHTAPHSEPQQHNAPRTEEHDQHPR